VRRGLRVGLVLLSTLAMIGTGAAFALADAAGASGTNSLDLCVVEPGFATPPDAFGLTTTGPKNFNDTQTLQASACGSYRALPNAGTYTVTQSQTPPGWSLAQIYCYAVASANHRLGTVDLSSSSATFKVSGPTSCIFAELPAGGGGGFSGGSSSNKSGTTTTTSKSSNTTTTTKFKPPPITIKNICITNPAICQFKP